MQIWNQLIEEYNYLVSGTIDIAVVIFLCFALVWFIQMLYYWLVFIRVATYKKRYHHSIPKPPVSVIIAARDEYLNLHQNLPLLLEQDYPDFEVVVVNNDSTDDSLALLTALADKYPHLKIVNIERNLNFFKGKKFPLSLGIKSAKHEFLLLTDADCKPAGKTWLNEMTAPFSSGADIILGYGDYSREGGIIGKLIRYDTFYIALQYLSFALAGIPYMGVGRNLAYKKELFFKAKGFIKHYHIASGDDDLFINSIARKKNVALVIHKEAHTISKPTSSLKKWCIQKRRHLSSGKEYRPLHKFLLGTLFFTQAVFFVLLIGLLSLNFFVIFTLLLFILRYFSQIIIFNLASKRLSLNKIFVLSFFTEAVMLCWYLLLSLSNLIRKPKRWN